MRVVIHDILILIAVNELGEIGIPILFAREQIVEIIQHFLLGIRPVLEGAARIFGVAPDDVRPILRVHHRGELGIIIVRHGAFEGKLDADGVLDLFHHRVHRDRLKFLPRIGEDANGVFAVVFGIIMISSSLSQSPPTSQSNTNLPSL